MSKFPEPGTASNHPPKPPRGNNAHSFMASHPQRCLGAILIAIVILLPSGCRKKPSLDLPPLTAVKGVVTKNGTPVKGGSIALRAEPDNSNIFITGVVGDNGTFELETMHPQDPQGKKMMGVPEGSYKVTYMPLVQTDAIEIPTPFVVEAGKVNEWKIELSTKK